MRHRLRSASAGTRVEVMRCCCAEYNWPRDVQKGRYSRKRNIRVATGTPRNNNQPSLTWPGT
eukprot:11157448-Lingulodinium_polyedra.AAC.1